MKFMIQNSTPLALAEHERIDSLSDALDMMANARYLGNSEAIIIAQENIHPEFFDLRTGFAGEVLQKFSTYMMRLAITGPLDRFSSSALRDFIYECNSGSSVLWAEHTEEAVRRFSSGER